jgi:hypothetical protein
MFSASADAERRKAVSRADNGGYVRASTMDRCHTK